jgi:hypothetical protein
MHRKIIRITFICFFLLSAAFFVSRGTARSASLAEGGVDLIDFEEWNTKPRRDLTVLAPNAHVMTTTVGTGLAHSGEYYLEIDAAQQHYQRDVALQHIPVKPNQRYDLSFFYRTSSQMNGLGARVEIFQIDKKGINMLPLATSWDLTVPAQEWTPAHRQILVGPDTTEFLIYFRLIDVLPGNKWFLDDISFKPSAPSVLLNWSIDPQTATLTGSAQPSGDIAAHAVKTTVVILQKNKIVKREELKPDETQFSFDLHSLTDGIPYYVSAVTQLQNGTDVISENSDLNDVVVGRQRVMAMLNGRNITFNLTDKYNLFYPYIKAQSRFWENNDIGVLKKDDPPPAPWSALQYNAKTNAVTDWNTIFTPGAGLAMLSLDFKNPQQQLATEPATLTLDGESLAKQFRFSPVRASSVSPNKVVLNSSGQSAKLRLETKVEIGFDGFAHYTLTLSSQSKQPADINDLSLHLRFPKDAVKYFYAKNGMEYKTSYATKEFYPTFWIGNDESGVLWCADQLTPAKKMQDKDWLTLNTPKGGQSALDIHLVNGRTEIPATGLTVEFALMPSPARPFDPALRNTRFRTGTDATLDVLGTALKEAYPFYGYPELGSAEAYQQDLKIRNEPHAAYLITFSAGYNMETIPQVTYFKKDWISRPSLSYTTSLPYYLPYARGDITTMDMGQSSWTDLLLWKLKIQLQQHPEIMGTYNDVNFPLLHEKNGQWSAPVFAAHEFHQRTYVLLQRMRGSAARTVYHQGLDTMLPYAAYALYVLNGEHLRQQLFQYSYYTEFMNLAELRATFDSPLGATHMLLPQYRQPEKASDPKLLAHTGGIAMLHDAVIWTANQEILQKMVREKINFGDLSKAAWYPYWKANPYLQTGNKNVVASFYERDGDLFIILFNNSAEKQTAELKVLSSYLSKYPGDARIKIYDPATEQSRSYPLNSEGTEIELAPSLPKLVTLKRSSK